MKFPNDKGFSLIEIMIAVALTAIMSTIAVPNFIKMRKHGQLKGAAQEIASTLNLARLTAISKTGTYQVRFDESLDTESFDSAHTYTSADPKSGIHQVDIFFTGTGTKYTDGGVPNGFSNTSGAVVRRVRFNSLGRVVDSTGNTIPRTEVVYLKVPNTSEGDERYRVKVSGLSGRVTVQYWKADTWVDQ